MTHFCRYWIVKKSMRSSFNGLNWIERCKCGRYCWIDCSKIVSDTKTPQVTKHWYDSDGVLVRVSGNSGKSTLTSTQETKESAE